DFCPAMVTGSERHVPTTQASNPSHLSLARSRQASSSFSASLRAASSDVDSCWPASRSLLLNHLRLSVFPASDASTLSISFGSSSRYLISAPRFASGTHCLHFSASPAGLDGAGPSLPMKHLRLMQCSILYRRASMPHTPWCVPHRVFRARLRLASFPPRTAAP